MNKRILIWVLTWALGFTEDNGQALPKYGILRSESPNRIYTLKLADTKDRWIYELKILRSGQELAHYKFCGDFVNAYWSLSSKFVAINNSDGHAGIEVWVISLKDGAAVTSHGAERSPTYDFYDDADYFPNLLDIAFGRVRQIYPQADVSQLRNGYTSVAYGWTGQDCLLLFHQFGFDNLFTEYREVIQGFTIWRVTNNGIGFQTARFRKVKYDRSEPMPAEVKKTFNYIP